MVGESSPSNMLSVKRNTYYSRCCIQGQLCRHRKSFPALLLYPASTCIGYTFSLHRKIILRIMKARSRFMHRSYYYSSKFEHLILSETFHKKVVAEGRRKVISTKRDGHYQDWSGNTLFMYSASDSHALYTTIRALEMS